MVGLHYLLPWEKRSIKALTGLGSQDRCREAFRELKLLTVIALYIIEGVLLSLSLSKDSINKNWRHPTVQYKKWLQLYTCNTSSQFFQKSYLTRAQSTSTSFQIFWRKLQHKARKTLSLTGSFNGLSTTLRVPRPESSSAIITIILTLFWWKFRTLHE